jgi:hypothetical protein
LSSKAQNSELNTSHGLMECGMITKRRHGV